MHHTFHISKLRLWRDSIDLERYVSEPEARRATDLAKGDLLVDRIYVVKLARLKIYYGYALHFHVHWSSFEFSEDTWEPYRFVKNVDKLDEFLASSTWKEYFRTPEYLDCSRKYRARCPEEFLLYAKRVGFQTPE